MNKATHRRACPSTSTASGPWTRADEAVSLSHGRALSVGERELGERVDAWAQALGPNGELLAVGKLSLEGGEMLFHPKKVLAATRERPSE